MNEERDATIKARTLHDVVGRCFVGLDVLREPRAHPLGRAERPTVRANDFLAIEHDLAVVIGDYDQLPRAVAFQPCEQLVAVLVGVAVAVIRVEEDDPLDLVGNCVAAVDEAEEETPAAAVAGECDPHVVAGHPLSDGFDKLADSRRAVGVLLSPRRPAQSFRLGTSENDVLVRRRFPQLADLGRDVLDVEVPVEARCGCAAERLLDSVAVGRCEDD